MLVRVPDFRDWAQNLADERIFYPSTFFVMIHSEASGFGPSFEVFGLQVVWVFFFFNREAQF